MMTELRHLKRQPVTDKKDYAMSLISFKQLEWTDLVVDIVDISPQGAGIEVERRTDPGFVRMDPGFVWFSDMVDGLKGGLLMWSKQLGNKYRGGIKFVPLSTEEEQNVQEKLASAEAMKDPTIVVDTILDSLKKSGAESRWAFDLELDL